MITFGINWSLLKYLTSANSQALISSISFSVHTVERGPTFLRIEKLQSSKSLHVLHAWLKFNIQNLFLADEQVTSEGQYKANIN